MFKSDSKPSSKKKHSYSYHMMQSATLIKVSKISRHWLQASPLTLCHLRILTITLIDIISLRRYILLVTYIVYTVVCKIVHKFSYVWCKTALGEVGVSLPWWCAALVLLAPGYWSLFLNLKNLFIMEKLPLVIFP
jgi:hypothetical protein